MDGEEKKKRRFTPNECANGAVIAAVAGFFAAIDGYRDRTIVSWVLEDVSAVLLVGFVLLLLCPAVSSLVENRGKTGVALFVAICLASNLIFLFGAWEIKKAILRGQETEQEGYYQAAYDDGYRAAKEELQEYYEDTYYAFDEMDEAANEGYLIGYEHGVEDTKDNAFNDGYNEGYSDGTRIAFSAINDLGISDLSGDEILAAWDEYYDEMIEIYGMPGPTIDGEDKRLVVAPDGTLHVEGCKALWGLDINSFVYFDLIEDGTGAGYALVCDQCHPLDDQFASWNNIGGNE